MPAEIEQVIFDFSASGPEQVVRAYGGIEDASRAAAQASIAGTNATSAALESLQQTLKATNTIASQQSAQFSTLTASLSATSAAAQDISRAMADQLKLQETTAAAAKASLTLEKLKAAASLAKTGFNALRGAASSVVGAVRELGQTATEVFEFAQAGERAGALAVQFRALGGTSSDLERLREATAGLVDETTLQRLANQANLAGIKLNETVGLLNVAAGAALQQGADFEEFAERAIVGVSRRSAQRLDDLGIILGNTGKIYEEFARKSGQEVAALSKDEQTLAVVNDILASSTKQLSVVQAAQGQVIARAGVSFKDLQTELQKSVATTLQSSGALDTIAAAMPTVQRALEGLIGAAGPLLASALESLTSLLPTLEASLGHVSDNLGIVAPLFGTVLEAVGPLLGALAPLRAALGRLGSAIGPLVSTLGGALVGAVETVMPLFVDLIDVVVDMLPVLKPVIRILLSLIQKTLRPLVGVIRQLLPVLVTSTKMFAAVFVAVEPLLNLLLSILDPLIGLVGLFAGALVRLIDFALQPLVGALELVGVALNDLLGGIMDDFDTMGAAVGGVSDSMLSSTSKLEDGFGAIGSASSRAAEQVEWSSGRIGSALETMGQTGGLASADLIAALKEQDETFDQFEDRLETLGVDLTADQLTDLRIEFGELDAATIQGVAAFNEYNQALGATTTAGGATALELARMAREMGVATSAAEQLAAKTAFAGVELEGFSSGLDLISGSLKINAQSAKFGAQETSRLADQMAAIAEQGGDTAMVFEDFGAGLIENIEDAAEFRTVIGQTKAGILELEEAMLPTIDAIDRFKRANFELIDAEEALNRGERGARERLESARAQLREASKFVQEMGASRQEMADILGDTSSRARRLAAISGVVARQFELSNAAALQAVRSSDAFFERMLSGLRQVEAAGEQAQAEGLLRDRAAEAAAKKRSGEAAKRAKARQELILEAKLAGMPEVQRQIEQARREYVANMKVAGKSVEAQIAAQQINFLKTIPLAAQMIEDETNQVLGKIKSTLGAFGQEAIAKDAADQIAATLQAIPAQLGAVFSGDVGARNEAIVNSWLARQVNAFRVAGQEAVAVFAEPEVSLAEFFRRQGELGLAAFQATSQQFSAFEQEFLAERQARLEAQAEEQGLEDPQIQLMSRDLETLLFVTGAVEQSLLGLSEGFESVGTAVLDYNAAQEQFIAGSITAAEAAALQSKAISSGVGGALRASKTLALGFTKDIKARSVILGLFEAAEAIRSFATGDLLGGGLHTASSVKYLALAGAGGGSVAGGAGAGAGAAATRDRDSRQQREAAVRPAFQQREQQKTTINMFSALDTRPPGEVVNDALNRLAADNTGAQGAAGLVAETSAGGM